MGETRILLADDHAVLRQGLRRIIEDHDGWRVVGEAANGRDAVTAAEALQIDILAILDIAMPILNGIDATRQIAKRAPSVRVLILSMHSDQAYVTRAVQAGARGYILKESAGIQESSRRYMALDGQVLLQPYRGRDDARRLRQKSVRARYSSTLMTPYRIASEKSSSSWLGAAERRKLRTCCRSAPPPWRRIGPTCSRSSL